MQTNYPFTPITGEGLGVSYSSLTQIGDIYPHKGVGQAKVKIYANVTSGNVVVKDHVISVQEMVGLIHLGFVYNSQAPKAWGLAHKRYIQLPDINAPGAKTAILQEEDGHLTTYNYDATHQVYFAPGHTDGTPQLQFDSEKNLWRWIHPLTQLKEYYDAQGLLKERCNAQGQYARFEYTDGELSAITAPSGSRYEIRREGNQVGFVEVLSGRASVLQISDFDDKGRIVKTILPKSKYQINYDYSPADNRMMGITQIDGTDVGFLYKKGDDLAYWINRIISQAREGSNNIEISYPTARQPYVNVIDGAGRQIHITTDAQKRISKQGQFSGYNQATAKLEETQFSYANTGQINVVTSPSGAQTGYEYDPFYGVLTQKTEPNGQITLWQYSAQPDNRPQAYRCISKLQVRNHLAYAKYYVYDTNLNGDGNLFLRAEVSSEGRVTEYRANRFGDTVSERHYTEGRFPLNSINHQAGISLAEMEAWLNSQDKQKILLTYYDYNMHGQRTVTQHYANVDKEGNGIDDAYKSYEFIGRDQFNNLTRQEIQQTPIQLAATTQRFDELNRLITKVDPLNARTDIQYRDNQSQIQITYPNGKTEIKQLDQSGNEITNTQNAKDGSGEQQQRITQYETDVVGRPIVTDTPDGKKHIVFYDRQNRPGLSVSPMGYVSQTIYDGINNYKAVIQYAKPIDPNALSTPPDILPAPEMLLVLLPSITDPTQDHINYEFYDASGRVHYTVDADNFITETIYDAFYRITTKIIYATAINNDQLNQLKQNKSITLMFDANYDRCMRYFYDNDSYRIGKQDAAGYVTEYIRDGAGNITQKILYGTPVVINLNSNDFNYIKPILSSEDAKTYYLYNARSQCIAAIDAEHYLTTYTYLPCGLKLQEKRYANKVDQSWFNNPAIMPILPPLSTEDQTTDYQYDLVNRPIKINGPMKKAGITQYDIMGNIIIKQIKDLSDPNNFDPNYQRNTQVIYDGWEQVYAEANPWVGQLLIDPALPPDEKKKIWAEKSLRHQYDDSGLKISSTNSLGQVTYYYYDSDRRLAVTINPIGAINENAYDSFNEISQTRWYANKYLSLNLLTGGFISDSFCQQLDALKNADKDQIISFKRNRRGLIEQTTDAEGNVSKQNYSAFRQCDTESLPIGNKEPSLVIQHQYDPRGLELQTTKTTLDEKTITIRREYRNIYGNETLHIDEIGGVHLTVYNLLGFTRTQRVNDVLIANYESDAFGRVLTEIDSLGEVTSHIYNQMERSHVINYPETGVKKILIANVFGEKIREIDSLGNIQEWAYAPDSQLAKYTNALKNQTENYYDLIGQKTLTINANKVQSKFGYNNAGQLAHETKDATGLALETTYIRNAFGNAEMIIDPKDITHQQHFDRRNLLITSIMDPKKEGYSEGLNLITTTTYNGQHIKVSEIKGDDKNSNQYQENYLQDSFNRPIGKVIDPNHLNIATWKKLDNAGKTIVEIDANGNKKYMFYDLFQRERFIIDAEGGIYERNYDTENRLRYERLYERAIDLAKINDETTLQQLLEIIQTNIQDSLTYYFYDKCGHERFKVNSLGIIHEKRYDLNGFENLIIGYSSTIDPNLLSSLVINQLIEYVILHASEQDRKVYIIRDVLGRERFIIDSGRYISEKRYDNLSNVVVEIQYAKQVDHPTEIANLKDTEVLAHITLDPTQDAAIWKVFDSLNRPSFIVDAEGAVISYRHDENGNLTHTIEFSQKIQVPAEYSALVRLLESLSINLQLDAITETKFDKANRRSKDIDPLGFADEYVRNALGDINDHINRNHNAWNYIYDTARRLIKETTPEIPVSNISSMITLLNPTTKKIHKTVTQFMRDKYSDEDINNILRARVAKLGNFAPGKIYLLAGEPRDGKFSDEDGKRYYVAVLPALDSSQSSHSADFFFNKQKQLASTLGRPGNLYDIFDDLNALLELSFANIKLLFPYNIAQHHWLTGEIKICKEKQKYFIDFLTHDPLGSGVFPIQNAKILFATIQKKLKALDAKAEIICSSLNKLSPYPEKRQMDTNSSGVIIIEDIKNRIVGKSLRAYTESHQMQYEKHIYEIQDYFGFNHAVTQKFLAHREIANHQFEKGLQTLNQQGIPVARLAETKINLRIEKITHYDKQSNIEEIIEGANTEQARKIHFNFNKCNQETGMLLPDVGVDNPILPASYSRRPEVEVTVTTQKIYNAKQKIIVEINENGAAHFYIRDREGNLAYEISANGAVVKYDNNSFGEVTRETRYAIAIKLDLTQYLLTGIPIHLLEEPNIVTTSPQDRVTLFERDLRGDVTLHQLGPIYYYLPNGAQPITGMTYIRTKKAYNAFRQCYFLSKLIDPSTNMWSQQLYWFDRNKKLLASCDPVYRVKCYSYDAFGNEIKFTEYAKPPMQLPTVQTTLAELMADLTISEKDRTYLSKYDLRKLKVRETIINEQLNGVTVQDIKTDIITKKPEIFDVFAEGGITTSFSYNPTKQLITKTYEDINQDNASQDKKGSCSEHIFYDACGNKIATTGVARSTFSLAGDAVETIVPLTHYGNNAFGQNVATKRFKQGTQLITELNKIPQAIVENPQDQLELMLSDNRGLTKYKQDAEGNVSGFTYTPTRKIAREWYLLTKIMPENQSIQYIDSKEFTYDACENIIALKILRDNQIQQITCAQFNIFNQQIAEGDQNNFYIFHHYNLAGKRWKSNADKGAWTIHLTNLLGYESARLQSSASELSENYDLSEITEGNIAEIFTWPHSILERVEIETDAVGRSIAAITQGSYQSEGVITDLPLDMVVGTAFPHFGDVSISWATPHVTNSIPKFFIWPVGNHAHGQALNIINQDGRCGVDVTNLITDVYEYNINYFLIDPLNDHQESSKLLYRTQGKVQIATAHQVNSHALVAIVENNSHLRLTGNTQGLTSIVLYQNENKIADIPITGNQEEYTADLSAYPSGIYQIKPVLNNNIHSEFSLPFRIVTFVQTQTPFSSEILSKVQLRYLGKDAQLIWIAPEDYKKLNVSFSCQYTTPEGVEKTQEALIKPLEVIKERRDRRGRLLLCNVVFADTIACIRSLSISLIIDQFNLIPLQQGATPEKTGPLLTDKKLNSEKDIIQVAEFSDVTCLYIMPLNLDHHPQTELKFFDTSDDLISTWKQLFIISTMNPANSINFKPGIIINVTGKMPGYYPFKYLDQEGEFAITANSMIYSHEEVQQNEQRNIPFARYETQFDAWNNKIYQRDPEGNEIFTEFNIFDKSTLETLPQIEVMQSDSSLTQIHPQDKYGYNYRGFCIGSIDANNHTHGFIVDNAGNTIFDVLPEGTTTGYEFDALSRRVRTRDPRNLVWQFDYNYMNNMISTTTPMNHVNAYAYDERQHRISQQLANGLTYLYQFDAKGNVQRNYLRKKENGEYQYKDYQYDHNHQLVQIKDSDNNQMDWDRDYFSNVKQYWDLGRIKYTYQFNREKLVIAERGEPRPGLSLKIKYYQVTYEEFYSNPFWTTSGIYMPSLDGSKPDIINIVGFEFVSEIAGKALDYHYQNKALIGIDDVTNKITTSYGLDLLQRRKSVRMVNEDGTLLRYANTHYNALGWETLNYDSQMIITTNFDAVGNRKKLTADYYLINSANEQPPVISESREYDYNEADWIIKDHDLTIRYDKGLRVEETGSVNNYIEYNDDNLLTKITSITPDQGTTITLRDYDESGFLLKTTQSSPVATLIHTLIYNDNKEQIEDHMAENTLEVSLTKYSNFNIDSLASHQWTNNWDPVSKDWTIDNIDTTYQAFDNWQVSEASGVRQNPQGFGPISYAKQGFDSNGMANAKIVYSAAVAHVTTPEGLVLNSLNISMLGHFDFFNFWHNWIAKQKFLSGAQTLERYFYTSNGQLMVSYQPGPWWEPGDVKIHLDYLRPVRTNYPEMSPEAKFFQYVQENQDIVAATRGGEFDYQPKPPTPQQLALSNFNDSYPPPQPLIYTPQPNETFSAIAQRMLGDSRYADLIATRNGWSPSSELMPEQQLFLPQVIPQYNNFNDWLPSQRLIMIWYTAITPIMLGHWAPPPPKPKKRGGFWNSIIGIVIAVIVIIVVAKFNPPLAAFIAKTVLGLQAANTAITVATAIILATATSAAAQGLAVETGLQEHFSLRTALMEGITAGTIAGIGAAFEGLYGGLLTTLEAISKDLIEAGTIALEQQLAEMDAGLRSGFNLGDLLRNIGEQVVLQQVHIPGMEDVKPRDITLNDLPSVFAREMLRGGEVALVDAGLNKLMGNEFNLEKTAAQALGIGMQRTARDYAEGYTSKAQQDYRQAAEQTVNQSKRSKQLNQFGMYNRNHQQGSGAAAHYGKGNKTSTSKLDKGNTINWLTADPESLALDAPTLNISRSSNHNLTVANTTNKWLNFAKEVKGFGEAIYDNVSGLMSNAPTPTSMTQKMTRIMLGENPIDVFINPTAIKNNLVAMYDDIHSMNPELKGYGWGNITFFGATAALPGGLVGDVERLGFLRREIKQSIELTTRLNRTQLREYLNNVDKISREQLINDLESAGLKLKGKGRGDEFMEFTDRQGRIKVKIHPPDRVTSYNHMHIYDSNKNPLDINLNVVSRRSPDAHIEIQPLNNSLKNEWRPEW